MPEYMKIPEVAALLRCNPRSVYEWLRLGKLPAGRAGNRWLITQADIDAFLDAGRVAAAVDRRAPALAAARAPSASVPAAAVSSPGSASTGNSAAEVGGASRPNPLHAQKNKQHRRH